LSDVDDSFRLLPPGTPRVLSAARSTSKVPVWQVPGAGDEDVSMDQLADAIKGALAAALAANDLSVVKALVHALQWTEQQLATNTHKEAS
jgi:hypothetical protein